MKWIMALIVDVVLKCKEKNKMSILDNNNLLYGDIDAAAFDKAQESQISESVNSLDATESNEASLSEGQSEGLNSGEGSGVTSVSCGEGLGCSCGIDI